MNTKSKRQVTPIFSDEDSDLLKFSWRADKYGYAIRTSTIKKGGIKKMINIKAHTEVCIRALGRRPDWSMREVCDHINRDKTDNRRGNLRIVNVSTNVRNTSRNFEYVTFHKQTGKWQAARNGEYIGLFADKSAAMLAAREKGAA